MSFRCRFKLSESDGDDGDGDGDDGDDGNRAAYIRKPKGASFWEQGKRHSNHSSSFQCHSSVIPTSFQTVGK